MTHLNERMLKCTNGKVSAWLNYRRQAATGPTPTGKTTKELFIKKEAQASRIRDSLLSITYSW